MDTLAELSESIKAYDTAKAYVEELEEKLKQAKAVFNKISQEDIPNILLQNGLSQLKTKEGRKITIKREVSPKIKDMQAFSEFLTERGEDSLLKTTLELGRLDAATLDKIRLLLAEQLDLFPAIQQTVHPMTLKAYIKELCDLENTDGVPIDKLPECLEVYEFYKTTIK